MIPSIGESNVDGFADGELGLNFVMLKPACHTFIIVMHA